MNAASDANVGMCHDCLRRDRDDLLFAQPKSCCFGDCPICILPLPHDTRKQVLMSCCSKLICGGCIANWMMRERQESLKHACPFCRHPTPTTQAEIGANMKKRVEANDPVAMRKMGTVHYSKGDYKKAVQYLTDAAGQGDAVSHYQLSCLYRDGKGVEKDEKKQFHHMEEAAIAGCPKSRFNLGIYEGVYGRHERAVKHFIIAANLGDDESVKTLRQAYATGLLSKYDYAAALRTYQTSVNAMKSPQREAAYTEHELFQFQEAFTFGVQI